MIVNVEDLRKAAKKRLPRMIYAYTEGGAYDERTARANVEDFAKIGMKQKVMVDLSEHEFATTVLGQTSSMPLLVAPTGFAGMLARRGEAQAARAAVKADIPFIQSTMSICSIEEVCEARKKAGGGPQWFQLYVMKDRSIAERLVERAKALECPVLILTVDCTVMGRRERDARTGSFTASKRLGLGSMLDIAMHPRWAIDMLRGRPLLFGNLTGLPKVGNDIFSQANFIAHNNDLTLNWEDVAWVRKLWPGKLVIKGIMDVEDAREAVRRGADGIVVSNHGGRQLDGAPSSIAVLGDIVDAVGDETEVLFDGGIRRGSDIVKAIAMGARACLIGRAMLYGLGAKGEAGVSQAIDMLRAEFQMTTRLMGMTHYDQLWGNRDSLILPS